MAGYLAFPVSMFSNKLSLCQLENVLTTIRFFSDRNFLFGVCFCPPYTSAKRNHFIISLHRFVCIQSALEKLLRIQRELMACWGSLYVTACGNCIIYHKSQNGPENLLLFLSQIAIVQFFLSFSSKMWVKWRFQHGELVCKVTSYSYCIEVTRDTSAFHLSCFLLIWMLNFQDCFCSSFCQEWLSMLKHNLFII